MDSSDLVDEDTFGLNDASAWSIQDVSLNTAPTAPMLPPSAVDIKADLEHDAHTKKRKCKLHKTS